MPVSTDEGLRSLGDLHIAPRWLALMRKIRPLRLISKTELAQPVTLGDFLAEIDWTWRSGAAGASFVDMVTAIWRLEKLGFSFCRHDRSDITLEDTVIPRNLQPILHLGMGVAAVEASEFILEETDRFIRARSHPEYSLFPYESLGCAWGVYSDRWWRILFRFYMPTESEFSRLPSAFALTSRYPPEIRVLLSHGYGRALYFIKPTIEKAIQRAMAPGYFDAMAAIQGIAFACLFVNHTDLYRVIETRSELGNSEVAEAYERGLVYGLTWCEWIFPGLLASLAPKPGCQSALIDRACANAVESHRTGKLSVFQVL